MRGSKQPFEFITHLNYEGIPNESDEPSQSQRLTFDEKNLEKTSPPLQRTSSVLNVSKNERKLSRHQSMKSVHVADKEKSVESRHSDDDNNKDANGVFAMTGIDEEAEATQRDRPRSKNTTTLRSKLFATVCSCSSYFYKLS